MQDAVAQLYKKKENISNNCFVTFLRCSPHWSGDIYRMSIPKHPFLPLLLPRVPVIRSQPNLPSSPSSALIICHQTKFQYWKI